MARNPKKSKGDPNGWVDLQLEVPRWMKNSAIDVTAARGQTLSDWVRGLLRKGLEEAGDAEAGRRVDD